MSDDTQRRVEELEERVRELEKVVDRELGTMLRFPVEVEPQYVDCICGEEFQVTIETGLCCPHCGAGSDERAEGGA